MSQNIYKAKHEIIKCTKSQTFPQRLYPGEKKKTLYTTPKRIWFLPCFFFIQFCCAITLKHTQTHVQQHSCRSSPSKHKNSCARNEASQEGISEAQLSASPTTIHLFTKSISKGVQLLSLIQINDILTAPSFPTVRPSDMTEHTKGFVLPFL